MPKKSLPTIQKVTFSRSIDPIEGVDTLEWIKAFLDNYQDRYLERLFRNVLVKKLLTTTTFQQFQKKIEHISVEERDDPTFYLLKYTKVITKCYRIMYSEHITEMLKNKAKDFVTFFNKYGHLTEKQIKYINWLLRQNRLYARSKEWVDRKFTSEINSIVALKVKPANAGDHSEWPEHTAFLPDSEAPLLEEEKEEEKEVQKFFSLKEIRNKLSA